ncbi:hypothetical protein PIN31009_04650 [Pandoraea iniqua]|uniref:Uncharacterized protein n=1 Tax=Pandoraea iniqua TaxID=2508288 RepID=A0A5E4YRQ4_9BURK|nr:hypothetical protein PIN31009_04650 [Pandoraea iniqua]VVE53506.1 hypothetical protein PIN31115_04833 [Pandoraea iniqua]
MDDRDSFDATVKTSDAVADDTYDDGELLLGNLGNDFDEEEWTW